jgi:hypothetical protein
MNLDISAIADDALAPVINYEAQRETSARVIEQIESQASVFLIAAEASKIYDTYKYDHAEGGFTGFMRQRLGRSKTQAYRYLDVAALGEKLGKLFPDENLSQLWETLPRSAVYLLAEAGTPDDAIKVTAERLKAGERPSYLAIKTIVDEAKPAKVKSAKAKPAEAKHAKVNGGAIGNDAPAAESADNQKAHFAATEPGSADHGAGDIHGTVDCNNEAANAAAIDLKDRRNAELEKLLQNAEDRNSELEQKLDKFENAVDGGKNINSQARLFHKALNETSKAEGPKLSEKQRLKHRNEGQSYLTGLVQSLPIDGLDINCLRLGYGNPTISPSEWLVVADAETIAAAIAENVSPEKRALIYKLLADAVPFTSPLAPGVRMRLGEDDLRKVFERAGLQRWIATVPADQRQPAIDLLKAPVIETTKIGEVFVDVQAPRH